ncbi:ATP-binding protein [Patescibacteria group bacterium]|nr:ATP-binding protein [Patescibacteria group bacterium]MBU1160828.1 ATP-binding protein [Patescibacteria group bacterium]MBU2474654.1 ATP-binding protein [Patescibacteria group bacterium]
MVIYPRKILNSIKKQINSKEIIVLTGIRRSGKTTLYRMLFNSLKTDNKVFLDMENPIEQKIFEETDYNNILFNLSELGINPKNKMYIFLDEIQAMPSAIKAIKYLYDHYNIKFFLTGSSSFYLKNLFPESLSGRKFVFEIFPLDFEEFLIFKNQVHKFAKTFTQKDKQKNLIAYEKTKKLYEEYMQYGGFPSVVLSATNEQKKLRLNDIFKSYFEKDVKMLADFRQINAFRDLILLLMQRVGSKIEISKLSVEIGVSRETVYSFLSFLEATYFAYFMRPFSKNVDKEVSGSRKVYLCDNGFINNFAKISSGALFENSVFLNLKKYGKLNYYEKRSRGKIDFILNNKIAFEIKTKGASFDIKKLKKIAGSIGIKQCYLLTKEFDKKDNFIPAVEV